MTPRFVLALRTVAEDIEGGASCSWPPLPLSSLQRWLTVVEDEEAAGGLGLAARCSAVRKWRLHEGLLQLASTRNSPVDHHTQPQLPPPPPSRSSSCASSHPEGRSSAPPPVPKPFCYVDASDADDVAAVRANWYSIMMGGSTSLAFIRHYLRCLESLGIFESKGSDAVDSQPPRFNAIQQCALSPERPNGAVNCYFLAWLLQRWSTRRSLLRPDSQSRWLLWWTLSSATLRGECRPGMVTHPAAEDEGAHAKSRRHEQLFRMLVGEITAFEFHRLACSNDVDGVDALLRGVREEDEREADEECTGQHEAAEEVARPLTLAELLLSCGGPLRCGVVCAAVVSYSKVTSFKPELLALIGRWAAIGATRGRRRPSCPYALGTMEVTVPRVIAGRDVLSYCKTEGQVAAVNDVLGNMSALLRSPH